MQRPLNALIVEDSEDDAVLLVRELRNAGFEVFGERVETAADMRTALAKRHWDVIISDYAMPHFSGLAALKLLRESGRDLPFILVSGVAGEEQGVEAMRLGAHDYLMKKNLPRLAPAVERELQEAEIRRQRRRMDEEIHTLNHDLERRVTSRTAELAAKNDEMEDFTFSVAYELQTPLRSIQGDCNILAGVQLDPDAQKALDAIVKTAGQMTTLIEELLRLFKISHQQLKLQATGLNSLVEGVLRELQPETQGRKIQWQIGDLPCLECDPGLVKEALSNLLSNAVKYTRPRNPAVIEIGKKMVNGQAVIFVKDNGVGFDVQYADKLFSALHHLHRREEFEGAGLGLAIVKQVVEKHGGRVWAETEVDRGATFYFTLGAPVQHPREPVLASLSTR
jgi:signal transduction histidine kinase